MYLKNIYAKRMTGPYQALNYISYSRIEGRVGYSNQKAIGFESKGILLFCSASPLSASVINSDFMQGMVYQWYPDWKS